MKIVVTGGCGFLGKRLVSSLLKKGHEVTVFSNEKDKTAGGSGASLVVGDILDAEDVRRALKGAQVVYHMAAILDESNPRMYRVNVEGTKNVIQASRNAGVKRIILPSSIGVLGYTKKPATEKMPYNPSTLYEKSKMESEKLVISSGIPYTIARMTIVYGPNSFWKQIFKAAGKNYPIIGRGENWWQIVYVDDAVQGLLLMLKENAVNNIYHIADDDPHTYKGVYETIAKVMGIEKPDRHVPVWVVYLAAFFHEAKCRVLAKKPDVTKMSSSITRLTRNRIVSIEKAKKELGYRPKYDLEKGMKETYNNSKHLI